MKLNFSSSQCIKRALLVSLMICFNTFPLWGAAEDTPAGQSRGATLKRPASHSADEPPAKRQRTHANILEQLESWNLDPFKESFVNARQLTVLSRDFLNSKNFEAAFKTAQFALALNELCENLALPPSTVMHLNFISGFAQLRMEQLESAVGKFKTAYYLAENIGDHSFKLRALAYHACAQVKRMDLHMQLADLQESLPAELCTAVLPTINDFSQQLKRLDFVIRVHQNANHPIATQEDLLYFQIYRARSIHLRSMLNG